jgi:hypothetical protein
MREWSITCELEYVDQHGRKQIIHVSGCSVFASSESEDYPPIDSLYVMYWAQEPFSSTSKHRPTFNSFITQEEDGWQIGYILHKKFNAQRSHFFDWLKEAVVRLYEGEEVAQAVQQQAVLSTVA